MEIAIITDKFDYNNIICNCEGGNARPANGQSVIRCRQCNLWQHHNCVVGNHEFPQAELSNGYVCRLCKTKARSGTARQGAATRQPSASKKGIAHGEAHQTPETVGTSPFNVSSPQKHVAFSDILSTPRTRLQFQLSLALPGLYDSDSDGHDTASERPAKNQRTPRTKMAFKLPMDPVPVAKASANKQGRASGADATIRTVEQRKPSTAPESNNTNGFNFPLPHLGEPSNPALRTGSAEELLDESKNSLPKQPTLICDCDTEPPDNVFDYITCNSCHHFQHKICMFGGNTNAGHVPGPLCIDCRREKYEDLRDHYEEKIDRARDVVEEAERQMQGAHEQREYGLRVLCTGYLWKHYCSLPNGQASGAVLELTSLHYANGTMMPLHPAPREWVNFVANAIKKMLHTGDSGVRMKIAGADGAGLCLTDPDRLLRSLREVAVEYVHDGFQKDGRGQLGVLAELLGLAEKGTYWKG